MTEFIQISIDGLAIGTIYALIALGFSIVYRVTSAVSLAQGGFVILSALAGFTFTQTLGMPALIGLPLAVVLTTIFGTVLGALTFVPALSRLSNSNVLMITVGMLTLLEGLTFIVWGSQPYAPPPFSGQNPVSIGGVRIPTQDFWVFATVAVVLIGLWYLIGYTRLGRALRACSENPTAASLVGINVTRVTVLSFMLATALAAIAGVVVAPTTTLQFDTGRLFTISGFIAVVIGGLASSSGALVGGLLLGLITQLATAYVSSLFSSAIALLILLGVLVWRPGGLILSRVVRRLDVRDEKRVLGHLLRFPPKTAMWLSIVGLAIALVLPFVVTSSGVMSSLTIAAIQFIALIGLDLLMGYCGQVSLGQAGFMAIGGYTTGYLVIHFNIPPLLAILAGMGLSLVCALILAVVTLRLRGLYLALATLAFSLLVDSVAVGFIDITGGPSGLVGVPSFSIAGFNFDTSTSMYYLAVGVSVVVLLLLFGGLRSRFGRAIIAIRTDQMAASALGVNVVRYKLVIFSISAVLASLSGSLYAFSFNFLSPDMVGVNKSFELVTMMVIGGEGTLVGSLFGCILLTLLPTVFQSLAYYKTLASGLLLIVCFLYLPQGIYGAFAERLVRWTSRSKPSRSSLDASRERSA
ncbi:MAG: hypothetical protein EPN62_15255 [Candidimonas sp.]|nr:MAG: hypothetical protein EPN77_16275 [Candidimonas sp.]TAM20978.1 MAG: hypothetical protein EPN62_15255 [Candidimonas sp.]